MNKRIILLSICLFLLTLFIIFPRKSMVLAFIAGGKVVAPEASAVLSHYCFGNGENLYLSPDYIKTSPVVLKGMKGLKMGQSRKVSFKQQDDWRLSYALNPFTIKRTRNGYIISQYMDFDKKGIVHTTLNLGLFKLRVRDNIAHEFKCTPYLAIVKR